MERDLVLKPFDESFLEDSYRWLNDPEILRCIDSEPVSKEAQIKWFRSLPERKDYKVWGLSCNGNNIGVIGLRHITKNKAEFFCYIGEKSYWGGCGKPIMQLTEERVKQMGLKHIWLRVLLDNLRAKKVYDRMGYQVYKKDDMFYFMQKSL